MKASIQDAGTLEAIPPSDFVAYLRSSGWTQTETRDDRWSTWLKDGHYEIAVPLNARTQRLRGADVRRA